MAASGRTVPSLIEVANSEAFLDPDARPANSRVFLDTIPYIRRVPNISTWPEVEDAAEPMLEQALYGGISAEQVAQQIMDATADPRTRRALSRPVFRDAERRGLLLLLMPYLAGLIGLIGIPAAFTMVMSLFEHDLVRSPVFVGLANFGELVGDRIFHGALLSLPALVLIAVPLRLRVPWPWSAAA